MVTVVWRDWFNEPAVKQLTAMGTLPLRKIEVDDFDAGCGETVARVIAEQANKEDAECFREGGEIVIVEPQEIAGTYEITVDYEPTFYASKTELE